MTDVQFEEEKFNYNYYTMRQQENKFTLTGFLIKKGIAQNEKQANVMLLVCSITLLCISFFLLLSRSRNNLDTVSYDIPDEIVISFPADIQEAIYKKK